MDAKTLHRLRQAQRAEITESRIYHLLAQSATNDRNREVLQRIGDDEKRHHDILARHTGVRGRPRRLVIWLYVMLARVFGVTFALRLMERGEQMAQVGYAEFAHLEGVDSILSEEGEHEQRLIGLLDDQRLAYAGSVVLGLNDALVELTGALAGLSLALAETRIVAAAGLVTGHRRLDVHGGLGVPGVAPRPGERRERPHRGDLHRRRLYRRGGPAGPALPAAGPDPSRRWSARWARR
jgi:rubrerythrin